MISVAVKHARTVREGIEDRQVADPSDDEAFGFSLNEYPDNGLDWDGDGVTLHRLPWMTDEQWQFVREHWDTYWLAFTEGVKAALRSTQQGYASDVARRIAQRIEQRDKPLTVAELAFIAHVIGCRASDLLPAHLSAVTR